MSSSDSTIFVLKLKYFLPYRFALGWIVWPEKMSYAAWQNLSMNLLQFIGKSDSRQREKGGRKKRKGKKRRTHRLEKSLQENEKLNKTTQEQTEAIISQLKVSNHFQSEDIKLELISMLKLFLEKKHIPMHIEETIPDRRNQDLITYSKQSIMMSALAIFLFRMGSGNKFDDKSHDNDERYSQTNMSKFINAPEDHVPVIKTIEKFFKNLEKESINTLMISFFKDLQQSKFFQQHPQIMPGDFFLLAADCVHTHTYDHPHHTDAHGNNDCEFCLKRVYNKKTNNEKVKWIHNTLVFSFVFMGGLKIPIYRYPIHAKQVVNVENESEDKHKQECELVALKAALPIIRQAFPRMNIVLLLDGLYANKPVIRLAAEQRCGYIIVRKDSTLISLAKECDEQALTSNHKKNCIKQQQGMRNGWLIEQKYSWFNSRYLGEDVYTNVLRFSEIRTREGEDPQSYKCEWLFSWKLSAKTCELAARQGRARWEEEDIFNSLKNRGFNFKHDYSRDPRSCCNWQALALFAFGIFELFRFSEVVTKRIDLPQVTLAEKLKGQLFHRPTQEIFPDRFLLKRVQFRYSFVVETISFKEVRRNSAESISTTCLTC